MYNGKLQPHLDRIFHEIFMSSFAWNLTEEFEIFVARDDATRPKSIFNGNGQIRAEHEVE